MAPMSWVRLKRGNDWGVSFFYHPDDPRVHRGDRKTGLSFKDGDPIRVRWPDGSESDERIKHARQSASVGDMGQVYEINFELAGIEQTSRGITSWVPLDAVDVWMPNEAVAQEKP